MTVMYISIYLGLLCFLSPVFYSFQYTGPVKICWVFQFFGILEFQMVFNNFGGGISNSLLLVYRNMIDFYVLTLYVWPC